MLEGQAATSSPEGFDAFFFSAAFFSAMPAGSSSASRSLSSTAFSFAAERFVRLCLSTSPSMVWPKLLAIASSRLLS